MCGIAGFADKNGASEQVLTAMMDAIIHRGPDGSWDNMWMMWVDWDIADCLSLIGRP